MFSSYMYQLQERDDWTSAIQEQIRSILLQNDSNKSKVCVTVIVLYTGCS